MRLLGFLAAVLLGGCAGQAQSDAQSPAPSMAEILDRSPAGDWRTIDLEDTLYMDLPGGRVIIELSETFTPAHTRNIRALARAGWFNGANIVRSQDNYVVQWGRDEGDAAPMGAGQATLTPEFVRPRAGLNVTRLADPDSYAREVGFADGWPMASDGRNAWMTHCYAMVGAGRGDTADSGSGAELYVVIGHAPRHLDRNIATVGRVLQGIELLSTMPRGTGPLGFYETPGERTAIARVRVAADVPEGERTPLQALRTDSATFRALIESRRFRRESWFLEPVGRINVCNVPLPVRTAR
ncbi:MAG: peptidylprolyl isomerase [Hyphomonadaceae bacterium]|nr:peptidylprolyl isomerase [Hyphomonadaceae bacterium]